MDETKIVNYFFVAGLPEKIIDREPLTSSTTPKLPIIDIVLINKTQGELPPKGYECIELTPTRFPANLNHGSFWAPEMYICYKRGRNTPPIVDIGVIYQSEELPLKPGCQVIYETPYGKSANINNASGEKIYLSFCRAEDIVEWDTLAVSDICVILPEKGETTPYAFHKIGKSLNLGMVGSDVYLCYRKSFIKNKCLIYNAELLFRYPVEDHPTLALPEQLPMFCLPLGATIERWCTNSRHPLPVFSTFVLTDQLGQKCYGASVVFYKDFDAKYLSEEQQEFFNEETKEVENGNLQSAVATKKNDDNFVDKYIYQQNQSVCLISKWPFFEAFKKFLLYIYRISVSGPQAIPIERYISQFLNEIPFPSPERPYISIQLSNEEIVLVQPDESPLPKSGASFSKLLLNLGPDICLSILVCVLLEHKVVVHSIRPDLLTCVAETVSSIIFPFQWQCPYVPLCPLQLSDIVDSPTPFIIGLDSCYFDSPDPPPPPDVTYMDLDAHSITLSRERIGDTVKILPKKALKTLKNSLEQLYNNLVDDPSCPGSPGDLDDHGSFSIRDVLNQQKQRKTDTQIQECFLRFMAFLLKGYKSFLLPLSDTQMNDEFDISALFDVQGFLKTHDKSYQKFLSEMLKTQYFCHFIEERSLGSKENMGLSFFDECVQKLLLDPDATLVEVEEKILSERTVVISLHDNAKEIVGVTYSYNGFTDLKLDLFTTTLHNIKPPKDFYLPTRDLQDISLIHLRRSRQEIKNGQKVALDAKYSPEAAARCLLWASYSVWFILLPPFIEQSPAKNLLLSLAYKAMMDCISRGGIPLDEIPYRIFFQLCRIYDKPQLAVKVYKEMKKHNMTLDVATYGYYNSAILEKRPRPDGRGMILWRRCAHVLFAISRLKMGLSKSKSSSSQSSSCRGSSNALNDFFNIFNKMGSPGLSGRTSFSRLSLRNTFFKKNGKDTTHLTHAKDKNDVRSSLHPGKLSWQLFQNRKEKSNSNAADILNPLVEVDRKYQSCEELKIESESSTSTPSQNSSVKPSRRNNSTSTTLQPRDDPVIKTDSLSNIIQSAKQHLSSTYQIIQSKLNSPSKNIMELPLKMTSDADCSNISCLAPETLDSSFSASSVSESNDHLTDILKSSALTQLASERDIDTDTSSLSSSVFGIPLHKRNRDESFVLSFPHLSVNMTSQMRCNNCSSLLYDEQIMACWNLSDSDLNTKCHCCSIKFVPMLHITIKESVQPSTLPSKNDSNPKDEESSQEYFASEFELQYLNPLVVRKELENILNQKGDNYTTKVVFMTEHSIIFWNLLWHTSRLGLPTHLRQMPLQLRKCESEKQIIVKTLWDSPHTFSDFGPSMHILWKQPDVVGSSTEEETGLFFNRSLLQQLISGAMAGRIPIDLVLQERSKNYKRKAKVLYRSIFFDVLFLCISALGHKTFDIDKFEADYAEVYENLSVREKRKMMPSDEPPKEEISWCRRTFRQLSIS